MSASVVDISRGGKDELPAIIGLLSAAALPLTEAEEADLFVANREGAIVGCAGLQIYGASGLLRSVVVAPHCRGHGIATKLVEEIVHHARSSGLSHLYLLTETAPDFFSRLGFAVFPRQEAPPAVSDSWEFRVGCAVTAIAMRLRL